MHKLTLGAAALLLALPFAASSGFAAGGGGTDNTTTKCAKGEVWDNAKQKCVVPGQGKLDDNDIYDAGRDLALAGRYDEAIDVLSYAENKNDARILNYLGYSHRKLGRVSVGLGYYQEALLADPTYTKVREYLGEAHLQLGDVGAAREQLSQIERLCGKGCQEYALLEAEIEKFKSAKGG